MITESFLNSCFTLILNKNSKLKKSNALYRDILDILVFCESRETVDIPITMQSKLDCIKKICELLLDDRSLDTILDSIAFSEKFKQHRDFLDTKINEKLKDNIFQDVLKQVRLRKKINSLFRNYDDLNRVLDTIKDGSFDSIDDLIEDYEVTIKTLYSNMMESNRSITIEAAASLDLLKDDYEHVTKMILKKYDRSNKTPTGFPLFDNEILHGGYEPSRLYVFGGGSGSGKSTFLNNSLYLSATQPIVLVNENAKPPVKGEIHRVYIYVTLENTIEESLMRTYQPMYGVTTPQMLMEINQGIDIKKKILKKLEENSTTIVMKYYQAMSIGVADLMGIVDDVKEQYPDAVIAGLYVDYLDLLRADTKYDMYRLELGHITLALKTLAVQYNMPVITGTQLGRSAYKIHDSKELSVDQISESIKKVEHADFVGLLAKDPFDKELVHGKIGKNRAGESNLSIDFKVDYSRFKFISATKTSIKPKESKEKWNKDETRCSVTALKFEGINGMI